MEKNYKFMPSCHAVTKKVLFSLSFKVRLIARNPFVPYDSNHVSPVASKPNNSMVETLHASPLRHESKPFHQKKDMGVSKNRGTPKWMVYNGVKMDDLVVPLFLETPTLQ